MTNPQIAALADALEVYGSNALSLSNFPSAGSCDRRDGFHILAVPLYPGNGLNLRGLHHLYQAGWRAQESGNLTSTTTPGTYIVPVGQFDPRAEDQPITTGLLRVLAEHADWALVRLHPDSYYKHPKLRIHASTDTDGLEALLAAEAEGVPVELRARARCH